MRNNILSCNSKGFLTAKQSEYEACLSFDADKLNQLLDKDESKWVENLDQAKAKADSIR